MTTSGHAPESLDELLTDSAERWRFWRARRSAPTDPDGYVATVGELIEALLPTSNRTLQHLAVDPRVWTHEGGSSENSVRGSVLAALTSLIIDHLHAVDDKPDLPEEMPSSPR